MQTFLGCFFFTQLFLIDYPSLCDELANVSGIQIFLASSGPKLISVMYEGIEVFSNASLGSTQLCLK